MPELVDQALRLSAARRRTSCRRSSAGAFERYPGHFARELTPALAERLRDEARGAIRLRGGEPLRGADGLPAALAVRTTRRRCCESKGVQGLLEDYLGEELEAFPPELKYPAVALLGQMVTSAGTRNVISAESLIERVREEDSDLPPQLLERGARPARERIEARPPRAPPRPLPLRDHERVPRPLDQPPPRRARPRPGPPALSAPAARVGLGRRHRYSRSSPR